MEFYFQSNSVMNSLKCPKSKSLSHCLTELFPFYQNKHWTIQRQDDRSVDPSFHCIILKIVRFQEAALLFCFVVLCQCIRRRVGSEGKKIHSCNILPRGCEFSQCGQLKPATSLPCLVDYGLTTPRGTSQYFALCSPHILDYEILL